MLRALKGFVVKFRCYLFGPFTPLCPPGLPWRSSFVMSILTVELGE